MSTANASANVTVRVVPSVAQQTEAAPASVAPAPASEQPATNQNNGFQLTDLQRGFLLGSAVGIGVSNAFWPRPNMGMAPNFMCPPPQPSPIQILTRLVKGFVFNRLGQRGLNHYFNNSAFNSLFGSRRGGLFGALDRLFNGPSLWDRLLNGRKHKMKLRLGFSFQ